MTPFMYELYIANKNYSSWSLRPWALMRELDVPFVERLTPFREGSSYEEFRRFSPNGKVPCLVHDGWTVWDSLAIVEHLAERHAGVWPQDAKARSWARSAAAEMHSGFAELRRRCPMNVGLRLRLREKAPALLADIARVTELWSEGLERFGGPFLAGAAFCAVDAFFAPVAFRMQSYGLVFEGEAGRYAERLLALPSLRAWEAAALREPWREREHDAETLASGELLEDRRAAPDRA